MCPGATAPLTTPPGRAGAMIWPACPAPPVTLPSGPWAAPWAAGPVITAPWVPGPTTTPPRWLAEATARARAKTTYNKKIIYISFRFYILEFWISKILIHARKNDFENFSKKKREKLLYLPKCSWLSMSMLKSNLDRWTNVRYPFLYFPRMDSNNGVLQIVK